MSEVVFFSNILEFMASKGRNGMIPKGLKCIFAFHGCNGIPTFNVLQYKNERYIWIKGTNFASQNDLYIDLHTVETTFLDGYAHSGFLNASRMVISLIYGLIEGCERVVCIGHSLGGAVATIIALILKYEYKWDNTKAFTFGTPGVLSQNLIEKSKSVCTTFVRSKDPIPRIFNYKKGIYAFLKFSVENHCNLEVEEDPIKYNILDKLNISDQVPGRVIVIDKKNHIPICRHPVPSDFIYTSQLRFIAHSHRLYYKDLISIYQTEPSTMYYKTSYARFIHSENLTVGKSKYFTIAAVGTAAAVCMSFLFGIVGAVFSTIMAGGILVFYRIARKTNKIENSNQKV